MMISRRHGFVFIHVPKTGGTSVEVALAPHLAWDDLILGSTPLGFAMNLAYHQRHGLCDHSSLAEIAAICGPDALNSSFVFATVRHPVDRIVSLYNFLHSLVEGHCRHVQLDPDILRRRILAQDIDGDPDFCGWTVTRLYAGAPDFSGFLAAVDPGAHVTLRPQVWFLTPPMGVKPVDRVLKLEEMDTSFPEIAARLGLAVTLERLNVSTIPRLSARDVSPADCRRIEALYYQDFVAFDYGLG